MSVSSCSNPTLGSTKRLGPNSRDLEVPRLSDHSTNEKQIVCSTYINISKWIRQYHAFIHSFILSISIAPLQVLYYSGALPTTARILYRSFTLKRTGNCRQRTWPRSLRDG